MKIDQFLYLLLLFTFLSSCNISEKKATIFIKDGKVGMIGYGSLISLNSMENTLGRKYKDSIYLVHLEGFKRQWNYVSSNKDTLLPKEYLNYDGYYIRNQDTIPFEKTVFLNIMNEKGSSLNCVLYFISEEELKEFDQREIGYERIDVTNMIKEFNVQGGKTYAYKALPNYTFNENYDKDISIIEKSYLDLVTEACDSIGSYYRKEYEETTVAPNPELVAPVIWKKIN